MILFVWGIKSSQIHTNRTAVSGARLSRKRELFNWYSLFYKIKKLWMLTAQQCEYNT